MTLVVAFECFGDEDLVSVLRDSADVDVDLRHSHSQGQVVNDLLVNDVARLGIVDEDPGKSHHRLRDGMSVVSSTNDLEHRQSDDRHLVIVKPDLERCFFAAMARLHLKPGCAESWEDLHRRLHERRSKAHDPFREDIKTLIGHPGSFVAELANIVRAIDTT